jgi:hypothetical protein
VKRGGGFNPDGGGWEFFNLKVTAEGTRITGRTQNERDGGPGAAFRSALPLGGRYFRQTRKFA